MKGLDLANSYVNIPENNKKTINHARKSLLLKKQFFSSWLEIFLVGPQRSILGPLLFNSLLNDLLWFNEKTDICNFADNNTLYNCAQSINEVIENLHGDLNIVFKWFNGNQKIANLGKCQFIIYQN